MKSVSEADQSSSPSQHMANSNLASAPSPELKVPLKKGFWQKRLLAPILKLLQQGLTPDKLALGLAAGAVCGVFPSLGTTSLLCILVGWIFGLNQIALQTANYLVYPLQIILLFPFFKAGGAVFGLEMPVKDLAEIIALTQRDMWQTIVLLWSVSWRAMILWLILAIPATWTLALPLRFMMRRLARSRAR